MAKNRRARRAMLRRATYGVLDGDLVEAQSFSLATKQRLQRERYRIRDQAAEAAYRREVEEAARNSANVEMLFGEDRA